MSEATYKTGAPPYPFGVAAREKARAFLLYRGADALSLGAGENQGYLLKIEPFDASGRLDLPGPALPFGCIDRRRARYVSSTGKTSTLYPVCTANAERSSAADDVPASTFVPGRYDGKFSFEAELFSGADPLQAGTLSVGALNLDDPEGELDYLRDLVWDGTAITIMRGDPDLPFRTWSAVARMATAALLYDVKKKIIDLRDVAWKLNNAPLHGLYYGGTGGLDGDASLAGIIKPYCVGQAFHIPPTLISAANLIYQVSCSSVQAITSVMDGAAPLDAGADYATYDALAAATVAPGAFATCLAQGLFRLGGTAALLLTAHVQGDNETINGLGYPSTRAQVARRIATGRGTVRLSDPDEIDASAYRALEKKQLAAVGFFWNQEITKAAALQEVLSGCLGWWTVRLNGKLAIGQLEDPANAAPFFSLDFPSEDLRDEVRVGEPAVTDFLGPRRNTSMGYRRSYTVFQLSQIAGSVAEDAAAAAILQQPMQYTVSADPWVRSNYPSSPVVTVSGNFVDQADAQREGDRQQRLMRRMHEAFEIPAVIDQSVDIVGRVISVRNLGRMGFGAARNIFCKGVRCNGDAWTTIVGWA
jgi:hypothetical protein